MSTAPGQAPAIPHNPPGSQPAQAAPQQPPQGDPLPTIIDDKNKIDTKAIHYAHLDKQRVEKERAFAAERQAFLAEKQKFEEQLNEFKSIKQNPSKVLELLGTNLKELNDLEFAQAQNPAIDDVRRLESRLEQLQQSIQQSEAARLKAEEEQYITEFKNSINDHIKQNSNRYEFILFEEAQQKIYDEIDKHYEATKDPTTGKGEILSISQAADKIEEQLEKRYQKVLETQKFKGFLSPGKSLFQGPDQKQPINRQQPRTLTNQASATPSPVQSSAYLTDEQRVAKAIAFAKGLRP